MADEAAKLAHFFHFMNFQQHMMFPHMWPDEDDDSDDNSPWQQHVSNSKSPALPVSLSRLSLPSHLTKVPGSLEKCPVVGPCKVWNAETTPLKTLVSTNAELQFFLSEAQVRRCPTRKYPSIYCWRWQEDEKSISLYQIETRGQKGVVIPQKITQQSFNYTMSLPFLCSEEESFWDMTNPFNICIDEIERNIYMSYWNSKNCDEMGRPKLTKTTLAEHARNCMCYMAVWDEIRFCKLPFLWSKEEPRLHVVRKKLKWASVKPCKYGQGMELLRSMPNKLVIFPQNGQLLLLLKCADQMNKRQTECARNFGHLVLDWNTGEVILRRLPNYSIYDDMAPVSMLSGDGGFWQFVASEKKQKGNTTLMMGLDTKLATRQHRQLFDDWSECAVLKRMEINYDDKSGELKRAEKASNFAEFPKEILKFCERMGREVDVLFTVMRFVGMCREKFAIFHIFGAKYVVSVKNPFETRRRFFAVPFEVPENWQMTDSKVFCGPDGMLYVFYAVDGKTEIALRFDIYTALEKMCRRKCDNCRKVHQRGEEKFKICKKCKENGQHSVWWRSRCTFCSRECMEKGWNQHKILMHK